MSIIKARTPAELGYPGPVGCLPIRAAGAEVQGELFYLFARIGVEDDLAESYPAIVADVGCFFRFPRWVWFGCGRVIHAADLLSRSVEPPESSDLAGGNLYV